MGPSEGGPKREGKNFKTQGTKFVRHGLTYRFPTLCRWLAPSYGAGSLSPTGLGKLGRPLRRMTLAHLQGTSGVGDWFRALER